MIQVGLMGTSESVLGMTDRLLRHAESVYHSVQVELIEVGMEEPALVDMIVVALVAGDDVPVRDPSLLQARPGVVLVWQGQALESLRVVMPSRQVFEAGNNSRGVTFDEAVNAIASLLWELVENRSPEKVTWQEATERLIRELSLLVDERDSLAAELVKAGADLDVAHERIIQLERLITILEAELTRTKGSETSKVARAVAAVALALLAAMTGTGADYLKERLAPTRAAADKVVLLCDRNGGATAVR